MDIKELIRDVPDFPRAGITYKDITPLLADKRALVSMMADLRLEFADKGITKVVGIESRGFILAPALAMSIGCGFVPIRKPNKLPAETISQEYDLEYGSDKIEIHKDSLTIYDNVLIVDDLLATGGTVGAAIKLIERCGASIHAASFIINLSFLNDGDIGCPIHALATY